MRRQYGQVESLPESEKIRLLNEMNAGNKMAREELINGNLRLVLSAIQRFSNRGENPDDLFQVGCIGLIKAIDNFDTSLDVRFSTYAVPMIIGEIRRYLRDNNAVRVSRSMRDTAYPCHAGERTVDQPNAARTHGRRDCPRIRCSQRRSGSGIGKYCGSCITL